MAVTDNGRPGRVTGQPTAGLAIKIYPSGVRGKVLLGVSNLGPERLTQAEAVHVLRQALTVAEESLALAKTDRHSAPARRATAASGAATSGAEPSSTTECADERGIARE